jgi:DNA processing protein
MLFVRGNINGYQKIAAIVGNRDATYFAIEQARKFSRELSSHGYTIISGLARGIDREAHLGALENKNGTTIATLAWLDPVYPPEHNELSYEIEKRGGVMSEIFKEPKVKRSYSRYGRSRFVYRNRIISGLSNFLIAIESGSSGGTIWQVELALAQGKRVYTLEPQDKINQEKMEGFARMVRMGAKPIRKISDLSKLEAYQ